MRLLAAGSLVRVQQGEPKAPNWEFSWALFFRKAERMFIGIPNGSLFCDIGSKAKGERFRWQKSGQKTAKKAKKHIAGKNWKEYDRYRRKNRKEALTFQQKHVEFRYTKESDWSWLHESAWKGNPVKIRDSSLYCKGYETRQSHWETGKTRGIGMKL